MLHFRNWICCRKWILCSRILVCIHICFVLHSVILGSGLDVHIDTPTETLHTILLGVVKYLWGQSVFVMDKSKTFDTFTTRLRSISINGLATDPVPNYIFTNRGSLNGKHFKLLGQKFTFCLHDLVSHELYDCWRTVGRLTVLLWYSTIHDVGAYMVCFSIHIWLEIEMYVGGINCGDWRLPAHACEMFATPHRRQR